MSQLKYDHSKASKPSDVETRLDFYIFRPIAAILVKAILNTSISPNHLTLISLLFGCCSGLLYYFGFNPIISAVLLFLMAVFDCADGQLARARGGGTPLGRFLDGLSDYLVGIAVFSGITFRLMEIYPNSKILFIAVLASSSTLIQCYLYDLVKNKYIVNTEKHFDEGVISFDEGKKQLKSAILQKNIIVIIYNALLLLYLSVAKTIEHMSTKEKNSQLTQFSDEQVEKYKIRHQKVMQLWTYLGLSNQLFIFIIAFLLQSIEPKSLIYGFWIMILPMNLFLIIMTMAKLYASKRFQEDLKVF